MLRQWSPLQIGESICQKVKQKGCRGLVHYLITHILNNMLTNCQKAKKALIAQGSSEWKMCRWKGACVWAGKIAAGTPCSMHLDWETLPNTAQPALRQNLLIPLLRMTPGSRRLCTARLNSTRATTSSLKPPLPQVKERARWSPSHRSLMISHSFQRRTRTAFISFPQTYVP